MRLWFNWINFEKVKPNISSLNASFFVKLASGIYIEKSWCLIYKIINNFVRHCALLLAKRFSWIPSRNSNPLCRCLYVQYYSQFAMRDECFTWAISRESKTGCRDVMCTVGTYWKMRERKFTFWTNRIHTHTHTYNKHTVVHWFRNAEKIKFETWRHWQMSFRHSIERLIEIKMWHIWK